MKPSVFLVAFLLVGCGEESASQDLEHFIAHTYAKVKNPETILPATPDYHSLDFTVQEKGDPFGLSELRPEKIVSNQACWQPASLLKSDKLEKYELLSMKFKGVMGEKDNYWALLEMPDASLHRVGVGRILGENKGRVDSISEKTLSITEHLSDGSGCWKARNVRLALVQN